MWRGFVNYAAVVQFSSDERQIRSAWYLCVDTQHRSFENVYVCCLHSFFSIFFVSLIELLSNSMPKTWIFVTFLLTFLTVYLIYVIYLCFALAWNSKHTVLCMFILNPRCSSISRFCMFPETFINIWDISPADTYCAVIYGLGWSTFVGFYCVKEVVNQDLENCGGRRFLVWICWILGSVHLQSWFCLAWSSLYIS